MSNLIRLLMGALLVLSLQTGALAQSNTLAFESGFDSIVAPNGDISLPSVDYRRDWALLGVWVVNGDDDAEGMHNVYTQRSVVDVYRETGKFPHGAVLIKELVSTTSGDFTTGRISLTNEVNGWFVMIKDTKNSFPDNALWGNGWGWAYFEAKAPSVRVTKNYKSECLACHVPAKDTDWIYSETRM